MPSLQELNIPQKIRPLCENMSFGAIYCLKNAMNFFLFLMIPLIKI